VKKTIGNLFLPALGFAHLNLWSEAQFGHPLQLLRLENTAAARQFSDQICLLVAAARITAAARIMNLILNCSG
jgi:hypothetical protein